MPERRDEIAGFITPLEANERQLIGLSPFEAFRLDVRAAGAENVKEQWFFAASLADHLCNSRREERKQLLRSLANHERGGDTPTPWEHIGGPGTEAPDLTAAARVLTRVGTEAFAGGAYRLAYTIAVGVRITLLECGPASVRGDAAYLQAQVLRALDYMEETHDTLKEALEDAVRSNYRELEAKVLSELSA